MNDNKEKYGIETIKASLKTVYVVFKKIDKAGEDGKVTWTEALSIGIGSFSKVWDIIKNGKNLVIEFEDMSENESNELKEWFQKEFDLENDVVEEKIEAVFSWILNTAETIKVLV